ncbi:uncharacterized protein [Nicotiana tomentosiformis]|uniref:uncharacterized protein n=1 Tax=Nicotiana tomentosiformis TaxID=4098 RepID=UPI00388C92DE
MGSSLFWFVNWTGLGALYFITPQDFYCDEVIHNVYDVVEEGEWDEDMLMDILTHDLTLHIIENIKPPVMHDELDRPYWMLEARGKFTVKYAWEYTRRRRDPRIAFKNMWVKGLHFKTAFFTWKVWKARLPLDDHFRRWGYFMPSRCWCYRNPDEETLAHVFYRSYATHTIWYYFLSNAGISMEGISLQHAVTKCWIVQVVPRLKPIFYVPPSIIL